MYCSFKNCLLTIHCYFQISQNSKSTLRCLLNTFRNKILFHQCLNMLVSTVAQLAWFKKTMEISFSRIKKARNYPHSQKLLWHSKNKMKQFVDEWWCTDDGYWKLNNNFLYRCCFPNHKYNFICYSNIWTKSILLIVQWLDLRILQAIWFINPDNFA